MNTNDRKNDKLQNEDLNKGNKVPNIHPIGQQENVNNDRIMKGKASGAPSQKSGSRGSADVQDGGTDIGSSAGSH
ncbi:hypothetical protein H7F15_03255 [Pontibacter sp. Tf4]|uniref:hypothetical protein n=1 Tax=Pontibacter sp. Tf4 TaxID=2761620 RepID=UPI001628E161|nr:hypothetical protein [Pontibacter sp. Tf4]MBB6610044.1 hypothetical protein [Pontibacter sp. Tf4]